MTITKKIIAVAVTLAAVAIPSLALADNDDYDRVRRDDSAIVQLKNEIRRDRVELSRFEREHRWWKVRAERREIERREAELNRLLDRR